MKTRQLLTAVLLGAVLLNPFAGRADDIDLYSGNPAGTSLPNLLVVLDTRAADNGQATACTYEDSAVTPNLSPKSTGIIQCALNNVLHTLGTNADGSAKINIGIMIYNANGFGTTFGSGCVGSEGGCLILPLTPLSATGKTTILAKIKSLTTDILSNNAKDGATIQEAWAYYAGKTGMSGRTYTSPAASGCQKNFVVFIGNAYGTSGGPGDPGADPGGVLTATIDANTALSSDQKTLLKSITTIPSVSYGTSTFSCGTYSFPTISNHSNKGLYADEWTRYMYQTDLSTGAMPAEKTIITYGIGILNTDTNNMPTCTPEWPALLTSMANNGGGKYFATSSYSEVANALLKILNEVQAVNSVFASSSLPVSVNAQGTYLNQIFMGMFRPDENGLPRWHGNLKQYKFGYASGNLTLVDSLGQGAISGAGTGFISSNAVSYWTTKNTAVLPDSAGGFWKNEPQGAGIGYDSPDGELVEKGGAAQVSRKQFLWVDYAAATGTASNPRNLYTYCPSRTGCVSALSDASNQFSLTNAGITASSFGASYIPVRSIERCVAVSANCASVDGTTAVVTTSYTHGYSTGSSVTITGATQPEYNLTQNVTVLNDTQFRLTGLTDWPRTPTLGAYTVAPHSAVTLPVATLSRSSAATASGAYSSGCTPNLNCETVTATFSGAHGGSTGDTYNFAGAAEADYNGNKIATGVPSATTLTYSVPIYPTTPAANTYQVVAHPFTGTITNITKFGVISTSAAPSFHVGQSVTISGTTDDAYFAGTWTLTAVTPTTVTISTTGNHTSTTGTISPSATPVTISSLSRSATTATARATATGIPIGAFANGQYVDITRTSSLPNEDAYVQSNIAITCTPVSVTDSACSGTTFTYPVTVTPAVTTGGTLTAANVTSVPTYYIEPGKISRSGSTARVTGLASPFLSGDTVDIATTGTAYPSEAAYTGTWTITCPTGSCLDYFTFGPVALTPATPATGTILAYSGTAPPDRTRLINWVRGRDNVCDEKGPDTNCPNQTAVNIRPSLHGDVLHSRPTVINYGGSTGVVVYYGANDGFFRAVNGNQTASIGSVPPGGEIWSFIPADIFHSLSRMRDNNPVLKLSTTPEGITPTPRKKDYFIDGSASVYQKYNSSGGTDVSYLYLAMRRGGPFMYALNVTSPTDPRMMWTIRNSDADFDELGQTWSQPVVAFIKGYCGSTGCADSSTARAPVLIFGGGYDVAEDNEPPSADTMGRAIYIVDAITGTLVWKATYGAASTCSGTAIKAACTVAGMNYSIPADITLMDVSGNDGYIDRLYAVDVGGNIWRIDLEPAAGFTPDKWKVTKLAALGCDSGTCASGTTPRKFLYPVDVISTPSFTAVFAGSGDREHPLYSASPSSAFQTTNRFYMVKDTDVGNEGTGLNITQAGLMNITATSSPVTTTAYDGTLSGYYITLGTGEKVVNAPTTVAGYTYFGTSTSATPSDDATTCTTNLGVAKGYQIKSLSGESNFVIYDGGGLPPTAVAGSVIVDNNGVDTLVPFCIGCGGAPDCTGPDCKSASGGQKAKIDVSTARNRTYWYMEID